MAAATCPFCEARGDVPKSCFGVVPQVVRCGHCKLAFNYVASRWEILTKEYEGEQGEYYMTPTWTPPRPPRASFTDPEAQRLGWLKTASTKTLVNLLRGKQGFFRRYSPFVPNDEQECYWWNGPHYTVGEIKAELATREHVPRSNRKARRERAQKAHGQGKSRNR